jgi:hypothetical protein
MELLTSHSGQLMGVRLHVVAPPPAAAHTPPSLRTEYLAYYQLISNRQLRPDPDITIGIPHSSTPPPDSHSATSPASIASSAARPCQPRAHATAGCIVCSCRGSAAAQTITPNLVTFSTSLLPQFPRRTATRPPTSCIPSLEPIFSYRAHRSDLPWPTRPTRAMSFTPSPSSSTSSR